MSSPRTLAAIRAFPAAAIGVVATVWAKSRYDRYIRDEASSHKPLRNPIVFMDIENHEGEDVGRVLFELRSDVVPKTAENFRYGSPFVLRIDDVTITNVRSTSGHFVRTSKE